MKDDLSQIFLNHAKGMSPEKQYLEKLTDFAIRDRVRELKQAGMNEMMSNPSSAEVMMSTASNSVDGDQGWKNKAKEDLIYIGNNYPDFWELMSDYYRSKFDLVTQVGDEKSERLQSEAVECIPIVASEDKGGEAGRVDRIIGLAVDRVAKNNSLSEPLKNSLLQVWVSGINMANFAQNSGGDIYVNPYGACMVGR